ncbi:MAG: type II toxin-antitoxin system HicB family antitoxin [Proteobacteria bacterium]|nr:type II toxin-antitoxin system HicB family antitoxin [Pseudomonadota bacterium]
MKYKDYEAIVRYSDEDETFVGEVINTKDILVFDGESVEEIEASFHAVVDEYLEDCAKEGKEANKPFSGKLMLRISPNLHRKLYFKARKDNKSLNALLNEQLKECIGALPLN